MIRSYPELPIAVARVGHDHRRVRSIRQAGAKDIGTIPDITVVIPHLNEPDDLSRCLAALAAQRPDGVAFEIIVVDNGSRELPTAVCARHPEVRLAREPVPGPGPARSHGARLALAPVVAFIDADCVAQPGWLEGIAERFAGHAELDVLAGSIGILPREPGRPTALELYESVFSYRVKLYVERDHYAATGNMAVRTHVFAAVGPFGGIATMEDRAWGQRAARMGFRLEYVPEVRVLTPACRDFAELARRWDRHIAHDFVELGERPLATLAWVLRAAAIAGSPAVEAIRLMARSGGQNPVQRLAVLGVLTRIRLRRARKMLGLLGRDYTSQLVNSWNRE